MTISGRVTASLFASLLVTSGCASEGQPVPLEDLPAALSTVFCDRVFDCFAASDREAWLGTAASSDEVTCTRAFTADFNEQLQAIYIDIQAGRIRYDGDAATSCLSMMAEASCAEVRDGFQTVARACEDAFPMR